MVLFYSSPPSPGSRQRNSRAELVLETGNVSWRALLQPCPSGLAGEQRACRHCYPYFQWKSGKLGFAQPPGSTVRVTLGVCGAGEGGEVSGWFGDVQMFPDIPILCLFLLLIQSVQLGMAEPQYPRGAGLVSGVVSGISFIQCTNQLTLFSFGPKLRNFVSKTKPSQSPAVTTPCQAGIPAPPCSQQLRSGRFWPCGHKSSSFTLFFPLDFLVFQ